MWCTQEDQEIGEGTEDKNAKNKNKEHMSLAGTIVELLKKDHSSSDGMTANMSIMLMRQMKVINKSMEQCARQQERNEERMERKHCTNIRAKKRAKKKS